MRLNHKIYYLHNFYNLVDPYYNSFWLGKFLNSLIRSGNFLTVNKSLFQVFSLIKLYNNVIPVVWLLEQFEHGKPLFGAGYVTVSGKQREFPKFLPRHKQFQLLIKWLCRLISFRKEWYLSQRIFYEMQDLSHVKRHTVIKRREFLFESALKTRFNLRFVYKKKR